MTYRRVCAAVVALVVTGLGWIVTAQPASASDPCSLSWTRTCLFDASDFAGDVIAFEQNNTQYVQYENLTTHAFNDRMSSWVNNSLTKDTAWFYAINLGGAGRCMWANSASRYVGWWDNDEASSVALYTNDFSC